jgi:hypothetical protein
VIVAHGASELGRMNGCPVQPKKLRVSLPTKSTSVEVRLESDRVDAPPIKATLEGGAHPVDVAFAVVPRTNVGILRVAARPATAIVSVDGAAQGNPPVEIVVSAGSHVVDVKADSFQSAHVPFVVEAGGKKELDIALEPTPPITKRWWFWAGAGAAVVGIATLATIVVVQPERESSRGNIDPGVVRAPLVTF